MKLFGQHGTAHKLGKKTPQFLIGKQKQEKSKKNLVSAIVGAFKRNNSKKETKLKNVLVQLEVFYRSKASIVTKPSLNITHIHPKGAKKRSSFIHNIPYEVG